MTRECSFHFSSYSRYYLHQFPYNKRKKNFWKPAYALSFSKIIFKNSLCLFEFVKLGSILIIWYIWSDEIAQQKGCIVVIKSNVRHKNNNPCFITFQCFEIAMASNFFTNKIVLSWKYKEYWKRLSFGVVSLLNTF